MTHGLRRFIVTVETAKHRVFEFLSCEILPEHSLIAFGTDDPFHLGVLSSRLHVIFSLTAGGRLGVGNDPRYNKSRCFDPFPFPLCNEAERERIRKLAEELDAHRKRVQAQHGLTLTGLYNVLEKLRAGERGVHAASPSAESRPTEISNASSDATWKRPEGRAPAATLTAKEKLIHDHGLVSVLKQLHDDLDRAVAAAYGWPWPLSDQEILERLVTLNAERAAEEKRGIIHWLRPEYQARSEKLGTRSQNQLNLPEGKAKAKPKARAAKPQGKAEWPKSLSDRVKAVETALHAIGVPTTPAELAKQFKRAKPENVAEILETLVTVGRAHRKGNQFTR